MEIIKNHSRRSKTAVIGFILSILWLYGLGSIFAVILGIISIRKIKRSNGELKGEGFAITSIILGGIGLILPLWILTSVIWTIITRS